MSRANAKFVKAMTIDTMRFANEMLATPSSRLDSLEWSHALSHDELEVWNWFRCAARKYDLNAVFALLDRI